MVPNNNSSKNARDEWYTSSHNYWQNDMNAPATIDGMLGGFSILSERDLNGSKCFLQDFIQLRTIQNLSKSLREVVVVGDELPQNQNVQENEQEQSKKELFPKSLVRCCECGAGIGRVSKGLLLPLG